jgi:hypothetical protein
MWPLTYCGGAVLKCFDAFVRLPAIEKGMMIGAVFLSLYIFFKLMWLIFEFLGWNDIG